MFCSRCGNQVSDDASFCPKCGVDLKPSKSKYSGYQSINNNSSSHYSEDSSNFGYALLSFFIPVVGIVLFVVWNKEFPKKAKSCLNGVIAGVVMVVVIVCCAFSTGTSYYKMSNIEQSAPQVSIE